jgi:hypothetical protein
MVLRKRVDFIAVVHGTLLLGERVHRSRWVQMMGKLSCY